MTMRTHESARYECKDELYSLVDVEHLLLKS